MNSKNTKNKHRNFSDIEEGLKIKSLISNSVFWRENMKSEESLPQEEKCQYFDAIFSPRLEYFILQCLGPTIPSVSVFKASLPVPHFHILLQNNTILKEKIASTAFPQIKMFPVQVSGGYNAQVKLYLPPGLREDEITQYPLIVHVYGAPGSQLVTNIFKVDWNTYLASSKNFIVAQIDSRGSGGQGYKLLHEIHNRLGTVEVSDQLEVTELFDLKFRCLLHIIGFLRRTGLNQL
ncbi:inactive dipeptidyl peptidase 10-like [Copidosoma floridanum]|uniref:inactive dipeptidyl peptidase 10-like n=1 Tax=Copidosoma floridanum TaxID=29053 RepID=UPI0006C94073|nr:inactive dipeptidyl peptidase 10-like [Copidosoma floridanum]